MRVRRARLTSRSSRERQAGIRAEVGPAALTRAQAQHARVRDHGRVVRRPARRRDEQLHSRPLALRAQPLAQRRVRGDPADGDDVIETLLVQQAQRRPDEHVHHRLLEPGEEYVQKTVHKFRVE